MLLGKFLNPKFHLEYFWRVQMLGEQLGKRLCEDLVNFEKRLGILSIKFLAVRYQIRIFETAVMRFFLFSDLLWNFLSSCSWGELGRVGAMPLPYRVDWLGWWSFSNGDKGGKIVYVLYNFRKALVVLSYIPIYDSYYFIHLV